MMHDKIRKVFKAGLKDKQFLKEIKEADGDEKPGCFAHNIEKHFFAILYYGWLVGKYGNDWESKINDQVKTINNG